MENGGGIVKNAYCIMDSKMVLYGTYTFVFEEKTLRHAVTMMRYKEERI